MSKRAELRARSKSELISFAKLYYAQVELLTAAIARAGLSIRSANGQLELYRAEQEAPGATP